MKKAIPFLLILMLFQFAQAQVLWHGDPNKNYLKSFYRLSRESGETGTVSTVNDAQYGKVWKLNKPNGDKRCEFARTEGTENSYTPKEGDVLYLGWRMKANITGSSSPTGFGVFQWKSSNTHSQNYPFTFSYVNGSKLELNAFDAGTSCQSCRKEVLLSHTLPENKWVSIVLGIKVSKTESKGYLECWINGVKQDLNGDGANKRFTHRTLDDNGNYCKWGAYSEASRNFNVDVHLDEMRMGTTFASVMDPLGGVVTENKPPTVNLTSPSNNAEFVLGQTINLAATASDSDGSVQNVNFKVNGVFHSKDSDGPYNGTFKPTTTGTYKLSAIAFDHNNGASIEKEVYITVVAPNNNPPSVSVTSPENNAEFTLGQTINLMATASDNDGSIEKVNFKVNDVYYSQDMTGPSYTGTFKPTDPGTYKLSARAFDDDGAQIEKSVTVIVLQPNNAPSGYFIEPSFDKIEEGYEKLYVKIQDTDVDGDSVDIKLYIDNDLIREEKSGAFEWGHITGTGADFTYETLNLTVGSHTLKAVILDERGLSATIAKDIVVTEKLITSINEGINSSIAVFPNPSTSGVFHLDDVHEFVIYDVQGNKIIEGKGKDIDISNEPKGVYVIEVDSQKMKLIK